MTELKWSEIKNFFSWKVREKEWGYKHSRGKIELEDIPQEIIEYKQFIDIFAYIRAFSDINQKDQLMYTDNNDRRVIGVVESYRRLLLDDKIFCFSDHLDIYIYTKESLEKSENPPMILKEEGFLIERDTYSEFVSPKYQGFWYVLIDTEVFLKYLWTMKNDLPDEAIQKEAEEIIYEYCKRKNIELDDTGFDYFDPGKLFREKLIKWTFDKEGGPKFEIPSGEKTFDQLMREKGPLTVE